MNEQQPNDNLEQFLRKHLSGYSEDPSDRIWQNIEQNLTPAPVVPIRKTGWWYAAAAVMLLALIGQYFYFRQQLRIMQTSLEAMQQKVQMQAGTPQAFALPETAAAQPQPTTGSNIHTGAGNRVAETQYSPAREPQSYAPAENQAKKLVKLVQETGESRNTLIDTLNFAAAFNDTVPTHAATGIDTAYTKENIERYLAFLPALSLSRPHLQPTVEAPQLVSRAVLPEANGKGKWALSVFVMPLVSNQQIKVTDNFGGGGPGFNRRFVRPQHPTRASGYRVGLMAELRFHKNWSLATGVTYREQSQENLHLARLEFQDGKGHGPSGPHGNHDYDFSYTAFDGGGATEVSLQVETTSNAPMNLPPDRPVPINMTVLHRQTYVEWPVAIKFRYTTGRWTSHVLAGAQFGFLNSHTTSIERVNILNPEFQLRSGSRPDIQIPAADPIKVSALMGLGTQWKLNERLALSAEGWYSRQIGSEVLDRNTRRSEATLGAGLGIQYAF